MQISGQEVLKSFYPGCGEPIESRARNYLLKDNVGESYYWTLDSCHFKLNANDTRELCEVIDAYVVEYLNALRTLERNNDLKGFRLVNEGVRLFRMRQCICKCVYQYIGAKAKRYPDLKITCNDNKIWLYSSKERLHFLITLQSVPALFWYSEPEFEVVLQSLYTNGGAMERKELWSPSRVCQWLLNQLIPDALNHYFDSKNTSNSFWMKDIKRNDKENEIKRCIEEIEWTLRENDKRILGNIISDDDLLNAIERLQQHFTMRTTFSHYDADQVKLYEVLFLVLEKSKLEDGWYSYIASNLGVSQPSSKQELIVYVQEKINEQKENRMYSKWDIDVTLRSIGACIENSKGKLGFQTIRKVTEMLMKLIEGYNTDQLVRRYIAE